MTVLTLTTGTMFIMWLGEQITERGIGNGMSLIIFAGIVVKLPSAVLLTFDQMSTGQIGSDPHPVPVCDGGGGGGGHRASSSAGTAASPSSTPSASSAGASTAAPAPTSR